MVVLQPARCIFHLTYLVYSLVIGLRVLKTEDKNFTITWNSTGLSSSDEIFFTVEAITTGWIGLGFSSSGGVSSEDIIITWVDANGKGHLKDMKSEGEGPLTADVSQDVTLLGSSESNGTTRVTFKRKLVTCDKDDQNITPDTMKMIYAYGMSDPKDGTLSKNDWFGSTKRGTVHVYLLDPPPPERLSNLSVLKYEMLNKNYTIPSKDTVIHCSFHRVPQVSAKHHVIEFEPVVTSLTYQMMLYACPDLKNGTDLTSGECYSDQPGRFQACRNVISGWAKGGSSFRLPDNVGMALPANDSSFSDLYWVLEVQYNNNDKRKGVLDTSGFRLHYTPNVRQYEGGSLSVGIARGIMIPPRADKFEVVAACHGTCTKLWITAGRINAFAYMLRARQLGRGIKVDWYRDGRFLEVLAEDKLYNSNFQETRFFREPKKILQGDSLKITCTMSSLERSYTSADGDSLASEMCGILLYYYPTRSIASCGSLPYYIIQTTDKLFTDLKVNPVLYPNTLIDLEKSFQNYSWTESMRKMAQERVKTAHHHVQCAMTGQQNYNTEMAAFNISLFREAANNKTDKTCQTPSFAASSKGFPLLHIISLMVFFCIIH